METNTRIIKNISNDIIVDPRSINISMAIGDSATQKEIDLPRGKCFRVAAFFTGNDPVEPVNISVKDTGGILIVRPTHYKDWKPGNAGYFESMKAVNFNDRNPVIHVNSSIPLTTKLDVQILFVVDVNDK